MSYLGSDLEEDNSDYDDSEGENKYKQKYKRKVAYKQSRDYDLKQKEYEKSARHIWDYLTSRDFIIKMITGMDLIKMFEEKTYDFSKFDRLGNAIRGMSSKAEKSPCYIALEKQKDPKKSKLVGALISSICYDNYDTEYTELEYVEVLGEYRGNNLGKALTWFVITPNKPVFIMEAEEPRFYAKFGFKSLSSVNSERKDNLYEKIRMKCSMSLDLVTKPMILLNPNRTLRLKWVERNFVDEEEDEEEEEEDEDDMDE